MSTNQYIAQRADQVLVRQRCQARRVAPAATYGHRRQQLPVGEPAWQVAVREAFVCHSQQSFR